MYDICKILLLILTVMFIEYFVSYFVSNRNTNTLINNQIGGSSLPRLYLFYSRNSVKSVKLRCGNKSIYDNQPNNKPLTTSDWGKIFYQYKSSNILKVREFDINRIKHLKLVKKYNIRKVPIILFVKNNGDIDTIHAQLNYDNISKFVNNNL